MHLDSLYAIVLKGFIAKPSFSVPSIFSFSLLMKAGLSTPGSLAFAFSLRSSLTGMLRLRVQMPLRFNIGLVAMRLKQGSRLQIRAAIL